MATQLTRRQVLRLATLGGIGAVISACTRTPATLPTAIPPATAIVPTAAPVATPTTAATTLPATSAPAAVAPTASPAAPTATTTPALPRMMAQAANQFLDALSSEQRAQATYAFSDNERTRWHWTTPQGFPRNGLPLNAMDANQRTLAFGLLQASIPPAALQKAQDIMALQTLLGNDPLRYYLTVFGEPGAARPWGWRWEGHHYSRQFTINAEALTMTPFFLGAQPTTTDAGLRAMAREEDAARELVTGLSGSLRDQAIFSTRTLTTHLTQNRVTVDPLDPVGVAYADLAANQQALIDEIIGTYLGALPTPVAQPIQDRIQAAGVGQIRFGWAGALEPRRPHYYRLQGPTFLLEFDNSRNSGSHIHSVWRDFAEDFGRHLVGQA